MKRKVVRSATLFGYLKAARELGIDGEALMAKVGLGNDFADHPDSLISADAFITQTSVRAPRSPAAYPITDLLAFCSGKRKHSEMHCAPL
jgi:hypothetical protein